MKLLAIDCSTLTRSIALIVNGTVVSEFYHESLAPHSAFLTLMLKTALPLWRITLADLDGLVVVEGPGSFTGVRVAVTTAKTLAYIAGKPVVTVGSLETLALPLLHLGFTVCTLLDARKKEVYAALYQPESADTFTQLLAPRAVGISELPDELPQHCIITGTALSVYQAELNAKYPNHCLAPQALWTPHASWAGVLATRRIQSGHLSLTTSFSELARLAPVYLRKPEAELNWEKKYGPTPCQSGELTPGLKRSSPRALI